MPTASVGLRGTGTPSSPHGARVTVPPSARESQGGEKQVQGDAIHKMWVENNNNKKKKGPFLLQHLPAGERLRTVSSHGAGRCAVTHGSAAQRRGALMKAPLLKLPKLPANYTIRFPPTHTSPSEAGKPRRLAGLIAAPRLHLRCAPCAPFGHGNGNGEG